MKAKLLRIFSFCSLIALIIQPSFASEADFVESYPTSQISLLGGSYSLSSGKKTLSGMGSVLANYQYFFSEKFSVSAGYQALFTDGSRSEVSGYDAGLNYCFFACSPITRSLGDTVTIKERGSFGITVGAGMAQRFFQLSNASLIYSGMYGKLGASYLLNDRFKILAEFESAVIKNRTVQFTENTFMVGVGVFFGSKK